MPEQGVSQVQVEFVHRIEVGLDCDTLSIPVRES